MRGGNASIFFDFLPIDWFGTISSVAAAVAADTVDAGVFDENKWVGGRVDMKTGDDGNDVIVVSIAYGIEVIGCE